MREKRIGAACSRGAGHVGYTLPGLAVTPSGLSGMHPRSAPGMPGSQWGSCVERSGTRDLATLVGRELASIGFERGYLQLHLDGPDLTVMTPPALRAEGQEHRWDPAES